MLPKSDEAEMNEIRCSDLLVTVGRPERPYRYLKLQLHDHWLNLNDYGRILVANVKCMTSHEAN